ncbi:MAG: lecithin retinol acyltransferase family protein [Bacillota bacterium]
MYGDIISVTRKPIGFLASYEDYKNKDSTFIDEAVARVALYKHYGIEIENKQVIHFVGTSYLTRKNSKIEKTTLEKFSRNGKIKIVNKYEKKFSNKEIVQRAKTKLNSNFGGYSITENNCEHFATWCATGVKQAQQSNILKKGYDFFVTPINSAQIGIMYGKIESIDKINKSKKILITPIKKIIKEKYKNREFNSIFYQLKEKMRDYNI